MHVHTFTDIKMIKERPLNEYNYLCKILVLCLVGI